MSSGKVKCTCGWSWNKSDSSKKDMYICHECGRDNSNNMRNGGWLDSYANGGTMQEHQENYNDSSVSLPEGFVGMGNNTKGRNYSPAWGGQFQMGGEVYPVNYVPQAQMGGSIPGAVGFTYARTQSPAPSNGKYAKKTMASAQEGLNLGPIIKDNSYKIKTVNSDPVKQWTLDYINSPKYKERLTKSGYENVPKEIRIRSGNVKNTKIEPIPNEAYEMNKMWDSGDFDKYSSHYNLDENIIHLNEKNDALLHKDIYKNSKFALPTINETESHELGHAEVQRLDPTGENDFDFRLNKKDVDNLIKRGGRSKGINKHDQDPYENKADLNSFRYNLKQQGIYDAGKEDFNEGHLKKARKTFAKDRLLKNYSDKDLIWLMNNIAQNKQPEQETYVAQNGQEMKYYQEGLDWKPKTISKNGGWLDSYDVAQTGKKFKLKDERDKALVKKDVIPDLKPKISKPLTAKQKEQIRLQKLKEKLGEVRSYTPQSTPSRVSEIVLHPLTAFGYAARNETLPENFSRGERNILDNVVDIVNPAFYLNQGVEASINIGNSANNIAQGNYPAAYRDIKNAGMNALMTLPLASEYKTIAKGAGQLGRALGTEEGLLSNAYRLNPNAERLNNINKSYRVAGLDALEDFNNTGVLRSQRILPENPTFLDRVKARPTAFPSFQKGYADLRYLPEEGGVIFETELPTFKIGEINPVTNTKIGGRHYAHRVIDPKTGKIMTQIPGSNINVYGDKPHWWKGYQQLDLPGRNYFEGPLPIIPRNNMIQSSVIDSALEKELRPYISRIGEPSISREEEVFRNVMGTQYREAKELQNTKFLDSEGNLISNPNTSQQQFYQGDIPATDRPIQKDGGVIKDDMGYWNPDNWDSPVEIGSNEITMKDVPFDVLGISDEGDIKHMKPGKNYKFKGKKVTEYPMAQNGLRQEQKGLVNLDNLTNFTNYNKPQPGGWLNKYN